MSADANHPAMLEALHGSIIKTTYPDFLRYQPVAWWRAIDRDVVCARNAIGERVELVETPHGFEVTRHDRPYRIPLSGGRVSPRRWLWPEWLIAAGFVVGGLIAILWPAGWLR